MRALQTGKMVSIDFLFPISVTLEHHHADTLLALSLKRTSNELACRSEEFLVFLRVPKRVLYNTKRLKISNSKKHNAKH